MKKIYLLAVLLFLFTNQTYAIEDTALSPLENEALMQSDNNDADFLEPDATRLYSQVKKNRIYTLDNYEEDAITAGVNIDTYSKRDIERQNRPSLTQILNETGSVTMQTANGSEGSVSSARIRGTDRVRMIIDGVRADRNSGTTPGVESQFILMDDIESVEVIKGPQGNVSGTNASGGVISLRTKRGEGPLGFELGSDMGSLETFKERAAIYGGNEKADFYLSTTWYKTDGGMRTSKLGEVKRDDYSTLATVSNTGLRLFDNKAELRNIFRFGRSIKDLGVYSIYGRPYSTPYQDPNNYARNIDVMESLNFKHAVNDAYDYNIRFGVYHNRNNNYLVKDNYVPDYDSTSKIRSSRVNLMTQHNFHYKKWNTLSLGYNLENEHIKGISDEYYEIYGFGVDSKARYKGSTLQNDVYVNDVINIKDMLFIRGGARLTNHDDYGTYVTPNGSVSLVLPTFNLEGAKTKFRGSWGQSINTPSLYQRFGELPFMLNPNPNLNAEKLTGYDFGIEQYFYDEKLKFEFGYFHSDYKDYIGWITLPDYSGQYQNVDKARIYGYEAKMTFEPNEKFKFVFNYTYSDSKDKHTKFELPGVPKNRFNSTIYYTPFERWNLYAGVETSSSRVFETGSNSKASGYVDARLGTSVRLFSLKNLHFYLKGNIYNLFNQNICMYKYSSAGDNYYAPKIRFNAGIFVEYKNKDKEKERV